MSVRGQRTRVAALVFGSGACALVYQVAWQREFRLIFGASTAASAAVIAIFVGGLGFGGLRLGKRADAHPRPLALYATLETQIALLSAATPLLFLAIRAIYVGLGGSLRLGGFGANLARLVLASVVIGGPTFLMGGTLPAAARAIERDADAGRKDLSLLYGVNTLGAVVGACVSTFLALELFGTRLTLIGACLANGLVAVCARSMARSSAAEPATGDEERRPTAATEDQATEDHDAQALPRLFPLVAALIAGFAFFLMEIVWYRMLAPLLGGTVFTFGLVLATVLFGIGLGGLVNGLTSGSRAATPRLFAVTCLFEAAAIALPFALGDRLALLALRLHPLQGFGFAGHIAGWAVVAGLVIGPGAFAAGVQFPTLVALVGRGRARVGEELGRVYAWNTAGAMLGAIGGGFGLLPALSATGCWRLAAGLLLALGVVTVVLGARGDWGKRGDPGKRPRLVTFATPLVLVVITAALLRAEGPTAAWRHSPIGMGRVSPAAVATPNSARAWINGQRRAIAWEGDGVESAIAIDRGNSLGFVVNGKVDGNARSDAATQVGLGLLGAVLHPAPRRAMVIGLGTGSSAGWLGAIGDLERVDVVELEPIVLEMAKRSSTVNHDVLANAKVHVVWGDAREALLTAKDRYDVIASEPSNPYRAGIASLYTREFYDAANARLTDDGVFVQWLQSYEIDARTVRIVLATMATSFPAVEIWEAKSQDLLLVARKRPLPLDLAALRVRLAGEPYASAFRHTWQVADAEGFLAHFVARASLARAVRDDEANLNTDDATLVEFGFARGLSSANFDIGELKATASTRGEHFPELNAPIDLERVADERASQAMPDGDDSSAVLFAGSPAHATRVRAKSLYQRGLWSAALSEWDKQAVAPRGPLEVAMLAELSAEAGREDARTLAEALRAFEPVEADVILARLEFRRGKVADAAALLRTALLAYRTDPWALQPVMGRALNLAVDIAKVHPKAAAVVLEGLSEPFATSLFESQRVSTFRDVARIVDARAYCVRAFAPDEPFPQWKLETLRDRAACYAAHGHPLATAAAADVAAFAGGTAAPFSAGLLGASKSTR